MTDQVKNAGAETGPKIERLLGLPGWFAPAAIESLSTLWVPRFSLTVADGISRELGAPQRVDAALSLSGRALCLLQYQGSNQARLIAWALRDFIALWTRVPEAMESIAPWGKGTVSLWLENTNASEQLIDARNHGHVLTQRNGIILHHRQEGA